MDFLNEILGADDAGGWTRGDAPRGVDCGGDARRECVARVGGAGGVGGRARGGEGGVSGGGA